MNQNKYLLYINGKFQEGFSKEWLEVINPADESIIALAAKGMIEDAEAAVVAASEAFENRSWSGLTVQERSAILLKVAQKMTEGQEELLSLIIKDSGATRFKAKAEVALAIGTIKYYAELIRTPYQYEAVSPAANGRQSSYNFIQREPIGVCAGIVPWNFPLSLGMWKIAPALAAGNTVVIKAPSEAPLALLAFAKFADAAGVPKGVLNILAGSGRVIGEYLAEHPKVDKISFTGSTAVGKRIMTLAANSNLKITTLELGGKSANIILEDADLDAAIDGSLFATLLHSGQVCESGTRLLVPQSRYEEILVRLAERAKNIKIGDPSKNDVGMGPVISRKQKEKIEEYIQTGLQEGARIILGQEKLEGEQYQKGFWVPPTIFADVHNDMTIAREEIFGPVLSVIPYQTEAEAVKIANDSIYGLGGGVWSQDKGHAIEVAQQLRTGTVWVNSYHVMNPNTPFGGYKQSGLGREMGVPGLLAYTQSKHIHVDLGNGNKDRYKWLLG
ncbi:MAG: aldehyde dehydrogenase family protein [Sporomusaceae bacterium]|nr:aldehyde dehydrogenase family protein [Sporomusaceae bacterium]